METSFQNNVDSNLTNTHLTYVDSEYRVFFDFDQEQHPSNQIQQSLFEDDSDLVQ